MNNLCNKEWSRQFLAKNFTKVFNTSKWKTNLEKVLFDKETSLLPATQIVLEKRKEIKSIRTNITKVYEHISEFRKIISDYEREINMINNGMDQCMKTKRTFVRACPDENCRGFLSSKWKCGVCDKWACPDCHILKGKEKEGEHVCDPTELATAQLLDKDTRCCPKCGTGIFKIEGCDQMWCTQCYTAFNWKTGTIETRQVHNPHYFEWMRHNGDVERNVADNYICGNRLGQTEHSLLRRSANIPDNLKRNIDRICESIWHLRAVQMPTYHVSDVEDNLELRVRYLENEVSEEYFRTRLQRENKQYLKKREIYNVLDLFENTINEILLRMLQHCVDTNPSVDHSVEHYSKYIKEVSGIRQYSNDSLKDISKTYNSCLKVLKIYNHSRGRLIDGCNGIVTFSRDVLCSC
jgi:hypothetical protein